MRSVRILFIVIAFCFVVPGFAHKDDSSGIKKADFPKIMKSLEKLSKKKYCGQAAQIFDAHLHYHSPANESLEPRQIIQILDKIGVRKAVLSSRPNENSHKLYDMDPSRFILGLMPYKDPDDYLNWTDKPELVDMVEKLLVSGEYPYSVAGEFHAFYSQDYRKPAVKRFLDLAVENDLYVLAHTPIGGIRGINRYKPEVKVIWAHAGDFNSHRPTSPSDVEAAFAKHPGLMVEMSAHRGLFRPSGEFRDSWKNLFIRYSDRFMIGTDPFNVDRWQDFPQVVDELRSWLCQLPPEVAEKLAWKNADRIFHKRASAR